MLRVFGGIERVLNGKRAADLLFGGRFAGCFFLFGLEVIMGRPSKSAAVLSEEGRSHRTKAEMKAREEAEQAILTGRKLREFAAVKADPVAHAEFNRVRKLLKAVGKDDALYEAIVNRYAQIVGEVAFFEAQRDSAAHTIEQLEEDKNEFEPDDYYKMISGARKQLLDVDRQIQAKRKMLFDIEKENAMTVASALRSIPKAPIEKNSELKAALGL